VTAAKREAAREKCAGASNAVFQLPPTGGAADAAPVSTLCTLAFSKVLTLSDVARMGRIILPRGDVETHFPPCLDPKGQAMEFIDTQGERLTSCMGGVQAE
jgi:hypothetical protein